jgi:hypothetical protein
VCCRPSRNMHLKILPEAVDLEAPIDVRLRNPTAGKSHARMLGSESEGNRQTVERAGLPVVEPP